MGKFEYSVKLVIPLILKTTFFVDIFLFKSPQPIAKHENPMETCICNSESDISE